MKQTLKKTTALLAAASLFALGSANATSYDTCNSSCDPCSWFDDVRISGEFILWKPCFENLDYGIFVDDTTAGATPINGTTLNVSHNWKPGFRFGVGIDKAFCGWNLDFDFARVEGSNSSHASATTANGAIYSTLFHGNANDAYDKAESKHTFTYMEYNILFSRSCCFNECHQFRPYIGVAGMILDQKIRAKYVDQTPDPDNNFFVDWDSDYIGTGLRFGSGYNYAFNDCLGFFFDGSFAMVYGMVSPAKERSLEEDEDGTVAFDWNNRDETCLFVPGMHISLGFSYDTCWCNRLINLFLGYEFEGWLKAPMVRRYYDDADNNRALSSSPTSGSLGFHGIRVGANVVF